MKMPFTTEQFLDVFKNYNTAIWPTQLVFYIFAIATIFLCLKKNQYSDRIISFVLSFLWLWMGIVYHLLFFTAINKAAFVFGGVFILEGLLFFYFGVIKQKISFGFQTWVSGITGAALLSYALVVYPILGYLQGHIYPSAPTFGLPCPTTIYTFGLLLWTTRKNPLAIVIIPILWAAVGFSAALSLGIKEDIGLLVSVVVFLLIILFRFKGHHPTAGENVLAIKH